MKLTLRSKFMSWLVVQTIVVYCVMTAILYAFNIHERHEHPHRAGEEVEEFYVVGGVSLLILPLFIWLAWYVSRQLLRPIQRVLHSAETIAAGALDKRINTDVPYDEIGRLGRTLNEAFDKHQEVVRRLNRFSFNAAHQLRNPLAAIRTSAEVCLQQNRTTEGYQETLGTIIEDSQRLAHTVEQLLMLARLGNQDLSSYFTQFDLTQFAMNVTDRYTSIFEASGIELRQNIPHEEIKVSGNSTLLEQALANIFDNAVRFTPPDGIVEVETKVEAGMVSLSVTDSGPGIPDRIKNSLFKRGAEPALQPAESSGLGLAIAADIMKAHGGEIIASTSEGGARFTLSLPVVGL